MPEGDWHCAECAPRPPPRPAAPLRPWQQGYYAQPRNPANIQPPDPPLRPGGGPEGSCRGPDGLQKGSRDGRGGVSDPPPPLRLAAAPPPGARHGSDGWRSTGQPPGLSGARHAGGDIGGRGGGARRGGRRSPPVDECGGAGGPIRGRHVAAAPAGRANRRQSARGRRRTNGRAGRRPVSQSVRGTAAGEPISAQSRTRQSPAAPPGETR